MRLGIMQPYFFPYIGYFSLIKATDNWIVFDHVQFIRHGWIERNRILKPLDGWQYISVPIEKHSRETAIKDVFVRKDDWQLKILRQLEHYKKKAPFYHDTIEVLQKSFSAMNPQDIVSVNVESLKAVCEYIDIPFNYQIYSRMDLDIDPIAHAGSWALNISKALNAHQYINPIGGKDIFDLKEFERAGIDIKFLKHSLPQYNQRRPIFEPGLSIIDVMMWNDPQTIKNMLDLYDYE